MESYYLVTGHTDKGTRVSLKYESYEYALDISMNMKGSRLWRVRDGKKKLISRNITKGCV